MSGDERDEILGYLRWIQTVLKWLGGTGFVFFSGLIIVIISDHYEQAAMVKDVQWMRPKVESLWYRVKQPQPPDVSFILKTIIEV